MTLALLIADAPLPGGGKDFVDNIVQFVALQHIPFVLVKPETIAVPTLIEHKRYIVGNFVFHHEMSAPGTNTSTGHIQGRFWRRIAGRCA
jgi:hypothetical protein